MCRIENICLNKFRCFKIHEKKIDTHYTNNYKFKSVESMVDFFSRENSKLYTTFPPPTPGPIMVLT